VGFSRCFDAVTPFFIVVVCFDAVTPFFIVVVCANAYLIWVCEIAGQEDANSQLLLVDFCFIVFVCMFEHNRHWTCSRRWDDLLT